MFSSVLLSSSFYQPNPVIVAATTILFHILSLSNSSHSPVCIPSVSHFCVGQSQLDRLRLTAFLYCKPTPYLARVDTGLHKRMRWNVERLRDDEQQQMNKEQGGEKEDGGAGIVSDTEL